MTRWFQFKVFAILIMTASASAQWLPQRNGLPSDHSGGAWAIGASDPKHAVVSAWNGLFLTTNGGDLWRELIIPSAVMGDITDVTMPDSLHVWVAHTTGQIDASADGGKTWTRQFHDSTATGMMEYIKCFDSMNGVAIGDAVNFGNIRSISMTDRSNGWVAGWIIDLQNQAQQFLGNTTDGGVHWIWQSNPDPSINYTLVAFIDSLTGFLSGNGGQFYKTSDGGMTWMNKQAADAFSDIRFTDANTGWAIGAWSNGLYETTNAGETWTHAVKDSLSYAGLFFADATHGWAVGEKGAIIRTTNGGALWTYAATDSTKFLYAVHFANTAEGWAVGSAGFIVHTTDGGATWAEQTSGTMYTLESVQFLNTKNGFACGSNGTIIHTTDGGKSWTGVAMSYRNNLHAIKFAGPDNGWICGLDGLILHTSDGGATWVKQLGEASRPALVLRTTNGGALWESRNTDALQHVWSGDLWRRIQFVTPDIGYFFVSGVDPQGLCKTRDGGKSWTRTAFDDYAMTLRFYNENIGLVMLADYNIGRTMDGGTTWTETKLSDGSWGNDFEFTPGNPAHVWFADLDHVFFSSDTGATWKQVMSVGSGRDIVFVDTLHGWLLTDDNLFATSSGNMVGVDDLHPSPSSISLEQNYPNPFLASTNIRYEISKPGYVTLKVYSLLGTEVATIVSEYQDAGKYIATCRNAQFPTGMYCYRLQANGADVVKRMLVK